MKIRVGFGYDVHQLVEGRDLWLGGVRLQHSMGLLGHSDADVLIHAICDALLGAACMRDIGFHFPDMIVDGLVVIGEVAWDIHTIRTRHAVFASSTWNDGNARHLISNLGQQGILRFCADL